MAILITCPKNKVPIYWRMKLEQKNDVIYFPFHVLKEVKLTSEAKEHLKKSKNLVITSIFGAQTFCDKLKKLNSNATIYVLSEKIKDILLNNVSNPIQVPKAETRFSLADELNAKGIEDAYWLLGDRSEQYYANFSEQRLIIYTNAWDRVHEGKALKIFLKQHITSALVTSKSNFDRMYKVMTRMDSNEYQRINYYVLQQSTGDYLKKKGLKVIFPDSDKEVLENVLDNLWHYEGIY